VRRADNLHVPIVLKYGSLNLLEPSGPVQACNGIALPLVANKVDKSNMAPYAYIFHEIMEISSISIQFVNKPRSAPLVFSFDKLYFGHSLMYWFRTHRTVPFRHFNFWHRSFTFNP